MAAFKMPAWCWFTSGAGRIGDSRRTQATHKPLLANKTVSFKGGGICPGAARPSSVCVLPLLRSYLGVVGISVNYELFWVFPSIAALLYLLVSHAAAPPGAEGPGLLLGTGPRQRGRVLPVPLQGWQGTTGKHCSARCDFLGWPLSCFCMARARSKSQAHPQVIDLPQTSLPPPTVFSVGKSP